MVGGTLFVLFDWGEASSFCPSLILGESVLSHSDPKRCDLVLPRHWFAEFLLLTTVRLEEPLESCNSR